MDESVESVTALLDSARNGQSQANNRLFEILYAELRQLAGAFFRTENAGHTLQPTALVHEAFVRLMGTQPAPWQSRAHFLSVAAQVMRHILVDHARTKRAKKRGDGAVRVDLPFDLQSAAPQIEEVFDVHVALEKLSAFGQRQAKVVEMRYFGGMTDEEIGHVLGVTARTVNRDWKSARAWLRSEIHA